MIRKAKAEEKDAVYALWKRAYPLKDSREMDFFMKEIYQPENCYVHLLGDEITSAVYRQPHAMMLYGRVLAVSTLLGMRTKQEYQKEGYLPKLLDTVLDACEHSELLTLVSGEDAKMMAPYGFEQVYERAYYTVDYTQIRRMTNFGCSYDPAPLDLLKVYSAFIRRFNGFYARDLDDFVRLKKFVSVRGGKIVGYYNGKNQIRGYAVLFPGKDVCTVEELIYLDSMSIGKLLNAALAEGRKAEVSVSAAENLRILYPNAPLKSGQTFAVRLNDADLFSHLYQAEVKDVQQAFRLRNKPLNLNEYF